MNESDFTPRVLAGLVLGEDPARFLAFRILEGPGNQPAGCMVVDQAGRKFVLSQADLERERERVVTSRLQARGRALVEDIAASLQSTLPELKPAAAPPPVAKGKTAARSPKPSPASSMTKPAPAQSSAAPAPSPRTADKPKPASKPKPGSKKPQ